MSDACRFFMIYDTILLRRGEVSGSVSWLPRSHISLEDHDGVHRITEGLIPIVDIRVSLFAMCEYINVAKKAAAVIAHSLGSLPTT